MVTIGNTILPGVKSIVQSSSSVGVNVGSPGDAGIVGIADFIDGVADPNEVFEITNAPAGETAFGVGSPLSKNIKNALSEGAYPVYAVAPEYDEGEDTYDWDAAVDALIEAEGDKLDFIGVTSYDPVVVEYLHDAVKEMESNGDFAIALAGADIDYENLSAYSNMYDSSRIQLIYPSTDKDGESIIGSYIGLRSSLGMDSSPMRKRLRTQRDLSISLSRAEMEALASERVNPIKNERPGAMIIDDMTTVADTNVEESEFKQGISRIVTDFVTVIVNENADVFIGELHSRSARNALGAIIKSELKNLLDLNAITGFNIEVEPVDAMQARVNVGVETIKPLRNITAAVTAGEVE